MPPAEASGCAYHREIVALHVTPGEYADAVRHHDAGARLIESDVTLLFVDGASDELPPPGSLPVVVASLGDELGADGPSCADLVVDPGAAEQLESTVASNPIAAASLVVLLRTIDRLPVELGLAAESAVYSMLQAGEEFDRWRGTTAPILFDDDPDPVIVERDGGTLTLVLNRPHRHNAITRRLRDALCEGLAVAEIDDTIDTVLIVGRGPSFCSGGDVAEFGARSDPALAHRVRLARSPARLVHRSRARTSAWIHGSTLGGGVEIAAFAQHVAADRATRIGLPEIGLGLIPGAGGTVSVTRRVGRQRCAALALAVTTIDAATALAWGLVDDVRDVSPHP